MFPTSASRCKPLISVLSVVLGAATARGIVGNLSLTWSAPSM